VSVGDASSKEGHGQTAAANTFLGRARIRALDEIAGGPFRIARVTYFVMIATCLLALAIVQIERPKGHLPGRDYILAAGSATFLCLLGIIGLAWLIHRPGRLFAWRDRSPLRQSASATAAMLAITAWVPLLLVPAYLLTRSARPPGETWLAFGYLDKRWVATTYVLGTVVAMVLLVAASRVVEVAGTAPGSWRQWLARSLAGEQPAEPPVVEQATWNPRLALIAKLVLAVALAAYFFGPPWHVDQQQQQIDYHEDVHFGGLQAISLGAVPYVNQASIQYGPGTQLFIYLYMKHVGGFSVVSFRESFALFHWLAATLFFAAVFVRLRFLPAAAAVLASVAVFPALQLFGFASHGPYYGFFGWGNLLRYVGVFILAMFLPPLLRRPLGRSHALGAATLGIVWGFLCYMSQENFAGGCIVSAVLVALLLLSRSTDVRHVGKTLLYLGAGFVAIWLPVLVYYSLHGELTRFIAMYFFLPSQVAKGYSNTGYLGGWNSAWGPMYYLLPFLLALIGLASLLRFRPFRVGTAWSDRRVLVVSAILAAIVSEQGALLRADSSHLYNTMLALPVALVLVVAYLPRVLHLRRVPALAVAGAVTIATLVLVPHSQYGLAAIRDRVEAPYLGRQAAAAAPAPAQPRSPAERRIGPGLAATPICCTASTVTMPQLAAFMDRLHGIIGDRPTYVASFSDAYPGLVYFLADLRPAPIYLEVWTLVTNARIHDDFERFFLRHLDETKAIVTVDRDQPEVAEFNHRYPDHRVVSVEYRNKPLYVYLANEG
jgi:hypothetical protein